MICIGIESSAHTIGIGIVDGRKVLANERSTYQPKYTGIHPRKAADFLSKEFEPVVRRALEASGVSLREIELVAFTMGPGFGACLKIGLVGAKTMAQELNKPIIGVNHALAHIEIVRSLCRCRNPLVVYVSGGNTQIIVLEDRNYRVMGETLDIGLGNLIDSVGRSMRLKHAHGSVVEKMAREGGYIPLPYSVKGMDLVFTGLLTEAQNSLKTHRKEDVCYSLQETAFSMLVEATERALALTKSKELILCGGVAQNSRLQEMVREMAKPHGCRLFVTEGQFNADNGAMIALTGNLMYEAGVRMKLGECGVVQKMRVDEVEVMW
ncbi:tRNA (adenosine(37)-N6)-threonylcarbamoyltransferase complex transferase subunit TsaD [Candidatus Micrarchaeota archaeon]|nr:tRNA (adenosine(37)-N6)-threonylcarbamoyltransferase complex transferase subunit TsaD [Candidatus Micrarchaeota archaeon]